MEIISGYRKVIGDSKDAEKTRVFVCRGIVREVPTCKEREYDLKADRARFSETFAPTV